MSMRDVTKSDINGAEPRYCTIVIGSALSSDRMTLLKCAGEPNPLSHAQGRVRWPRDNHVAPSNLPDAKCLLEVVMREVFGLEQVVHASGEELHWVIGSLHGPGGPVDKPFLVPADD